jgi:hypothetical protein
MSRPGDSAAAPTRDTVARIFGRLTADRDELRAELELCLRRLAALERRLATQPRGDAEPSEGRNDAGDKALRLAEEALATAQFALEQARRPR